MRDYEMLSDVKEAIYRTLTDVAEAFNELIIEATDESERESVSPQANMMYSFANDVLQNLMISQRY